jgi:hypothetical protein
VLSAGALATALSHNAASAQAPALLVASTLKSAALVAAGHAAAAAASAPVAALTEGVLKAMLLSKVKGALTIVLPILLLCSGVGLVTRQALAERSTRPQRPQEQAARAVEESRAAPQPVVFVDEPIAFQRGAPSRQEVRGVVKSVDVGAGVITVAMGGGRDAPPTEKTYSLAKNVEVAIGGGGDGRLSGGLFKEGKLADLSEGIVVSLTLTADQKAVESILAEAPTVRGVLKSVDAKKGTLTVSRAARGRDAGDEEQTYTAAANIEVALDSGRAIRHAIREGRLDDLTAGAIVTLRLSLDRKHVQSVLAEGAIVSGVVKSLDPEKRTLTVMVRPPRGDDAGEERLMTVAKDALVVLDDGKGRRLSAREAKLADVPTGVAVSLKLSPDQNLVMGCWAEGPMLSGLFKTADADKGTITIAIPRGRDDAEEKTVSVARDARITLDGAEVKLADLKAGDSPLHVQLRLTLDQKAAQAVQVGQAGRR